MNADRAPQLKGGGLQQVRSKNMQECTFCKIIRGESPSSLVYESELVVALLDIHPINSGHTLVMPRRHVMAFTDLVRDEVEQIACVGHSIASALKANLSHCEGVTLSLADGEAAGQEVPHAHLHVIPRCTGDGFGWQFPHGYGLAAERADLDATAARIRAELDIVTGNATNTVDHTPPN